MFWQKVRHHLFFMFLGTLLLAQGLIFVTSKANPVQHYDLVANFISPTSQSSLAVGQSINLQAQLSGKQYNNNAIVYLVVASPEKNIHLNFETSRQADGTWLADNVWETKDWPAGIYQLSAVANIFDDQHRLLASLNSAPSLVQLVDVSEPVAVSTSQPETSDVVSPIKSATDDTVGIPLGSNHGSTTPTSTPPAVTTTTTSTTPSAPSTAPEKKISLVVPANNSVINNPQFTLRLTTNFAAENLSLELLNADSAAISTGSLMIDRVDGLNWNKAISLNDTFINGNYKLLVAAKIPNETTLLDATFDLRLNLPTVVKPADVVLTIADVDASTGGPLNLKATSNNILNSLQFAAKSSLDKKEVLRTDGNLLVGVASTTQQYFYLWDTKTTPNGNYYVWAETTIGGTVVKSPSKLITVFNADQASASATTTTTTLPESAASSTSPDLSANSTTDIDCLKSGISDDLQCQKFKAEISGQIPSSCLAQNIFAAKACEDYLQQNQVAQVCVDQKITDTIKCQKYLVDTFASQLTCQLVATSTCPDIIRNDYLNRVVAARQLQHSLGLAVTADFGLNTTVSDLSKKISEAGIVGITLPLIQAETSIFVGQAKADLVLASNDQLVSHNPLVIMIDSDGDQLPDDLEKYYGTDPNKADTDGDGFPDGQEIKNGFDPLGPGKLIATRSNLDQTFFANLPLEQPFSNSNKALASWQVQSAETKSTGLSISGQADPDTWVNIYLYSDVPLLFTVKTDASGAWNYSFDKNLSEGLHKIFVASNDATGKLIRQSEALAFTVTNVAKAAEAVTTSSAPVQINPNGDLKFAITKNMYYIIGGVFFLIFIIGIVLLTKRGRRIVAESQAEDALPLDNDQAPQDQ